MANIAGKVRIEMQELSEYTSAAMLQTSILAKNKK